MRQFFLIAIVCYVYILFYAVAGYRVGRRRAGAVSAAKASAIAT